MERLGLDRFAQTVRRVCHVPFASPFAKSSSLFLLAYLRSTTEKSSILGAVGRRPTSWKLVTCESVSDRMRAKKLSGVSTQQWESAYSCSAFSASIRDPAKFRLWP